MAIGRRRCYYYYYHFFFPPHLSLSIVRFPRPRPPPPPTCNFNAVFILIVSVAFLSRRVRQIFSYTFLNKTPKTEYEIYILRIIEEGKYLRKKTGILFSRFVLDDSNKKKFPVRNTFFFSDIFNIVFLIVFKSFNLRKKCIFF